MTAPRSRRLVLALPLLIVAAPACAEQEDEQAWFQINTNVPLGDRFKLTLEQIARFSDRQDGLYQTEFGGLVSTKIAKTVELGFGYRRVGAYNGNKAADENRIRQHIVASFGPLLTRLRVDERFSEAGHGVGIRIRPLIRYNRKVGTKGVALFASHESFILPNSTAWGQRAGYERMRNIVGVTLPFGKLFSADVGYLNQYRFGRGGARDQMDHAVTVQLTINLGGSGHGPHADD